MLHENISVIIYDLVNHIRRQQITAVCDGRYGGELHERGYLECLSKGVNRKRNESEIII